MRKKIIIVICILGIIIPLFSYNFWVVHYFHFYNNGILYDPTGSKPFMSLMRSSNDNYVFSINYNIETEYKISNFEYYNGMIQIGEFNFILNKDESTINIRAGINDWQNEIYWVNFGQELKSMMNESELIINNENGSMWKYYFRFNLFNINNDDINNIIKKHKNNNAKTKVYLKYGLIMDDQLYNIEIIEEYELRIITQTTNIFQIILIYLLSGGRGVG
jgi:hypothetical protein